LIDNHGFKRYSLIAGDYSNNYCFL
jgi:hypothetical protein